MEQKSTFWKSAMTYGIYLALINIVVALVIWAGGLLEKMGFMGFIVIFVVNFAIMITFLIISTKKHRDNELDGNITYGQAFVFGLVVVVASTVISGLFSYILNKFIDPDYTHRIMTAIQEKTLNWMSSKGVSQDQIDATLSKFEEKGIPTAFESLRQNLLSGFIGGSILSLISSAIVKKKTNEDAFEEAMDDIKSEE